LLHLRVLDDLFADAFEDGGALAAIRNPTPPVTGAQSAG
jgi:hypothetical protein